MTYYEFKRGKDKKKRNRRSGGIGLAKAALIAGGVAGAGGAAIAGIRKAKKTNRLIASGDLMSGPGPISSAMNRVKRAGGAVANPVKNVARRGSSAVTRAAKKVGNAANQRFRPNRYGKEIRFF